MSQIAEIYKERLHYPNKALDDVAQEYLNSLVDGKNRVWVKCDEHGETWHSSFVTNGQHVCHCLKCVKESKQKTNYRNSNIHFSAKLKSSNLIGVIPFYKLTNYSQSVHQKIAMAYLEEYANQIDESLFICGNKDTGKTLFGKAIGLNAVMMGKSVIRLEEDGWANYLNDEIYQQQIDGHDLVIFDEINEHCDFYTVTECLYQLHQKGITFVVISEFDMETLLMEKLIYHEDYEYLTFLYGYGHVDCQWQGYQAWKAQKQAC